MTTEQVQAYVGREYPDMHLNVRRHRGQEMVFDISGGLDFTAHLDECENLDKIKSRLVIALGELIILAEDNIDKLEKRG